MTVVDVFLDCLISTNEVNVTIPIDGKSIIFRFKQTTYEVEVVENGEIIEGWMQPYQGVVEGLR